MTKSSQVNYYITEQDLLAFEAFLNSKGGKFIGLPLVSNEVEIFDSLKEIYQNKKYWPYSFRIVHQDWLDQIELNFIEKQNYYLINTVRSPILELGRCNVDEKDKKIRRARIYYVKGYFDSHGQWEYKDKAFILWADSIIKEFKKRFKKKDNASNRISSKVQTLIEDEGWQLAM